MSDTLLTIKEVSQKLGVHWQTVRSFIQKNKLKSYKLGKSVRVQKSDLDSFIQNLTNTTQSALEIEKRYLIQDITKFAKILLDEGGIISYQARLVDHWFLPAHIKSMSQHDVWFNKKRGCSIRIREQDNGYTGKIITSMETKRLTDSLDHTMLLEADVSIDNYEKGKRLLEMMDLKEFLTIDKNRVMYKLDEFKIAIDDVKGLGTGVELEISTYEDLPQALKRLAEMADRLHLSKNNLLEKSLTVLAMQKLATF